MGAVLKDISTSEDKIQEPEKFFKKKLRNNQIQIQILILNL